MKEKRLILALAIVAVMGSGVTVFASTFYGSLSVSINSRYAAVTTGHSASHTYKVLKDKITAYVAVGGADKDAVTSGQCYTKVVGNQSGESLTAKCGKYGAASAVLTENISTNNTSCTVTCYCLTNNDTQVHILVGQ